MRAAPRLLQETGRRVTRPGPTGWVPLAGPVRPVAAGPWQQAPADGPRGLAHTSGRPEGSNTRLGRAPTRAGQRRTLGSRAAAALWAARSAGSPYRRGSGSGRWTWLAPP